MLFRSPSLKVRFHTVWVTLSLSIFLMYSLSILSAHCSGVFLIEFIAFSRSLILIYLPWFFIVAALLLPEPEPELEPVPELLELEDPDEPEESELLLDEAGESEPLPVDWQNNGAEINNIRKVATRRLRMDQSIVNLIKQIRAVQGYLR